jgi:acetolactate synthase-1/2/3 large subunit
VDFNAHDPARVAEGFGLKALRIKTPEELVQGLKTAFSSDQPIFIDVITEPEVETLPPVFSWLKAAESK